MQYIPTIAMAAYIGPDAFASLAMLIIVDAAHNATQNTRQNNNNALRLTDSEASSSDLENDSDLENASDEVGRLLDHGSHELPQALAQELDISMDQAITVYGSGDNQGPFEVFWGRVIQYYTGARSALANRIAEGVQTCRNISQTGVNTWHGVTYYAQASRDYTVNTYHSFREGTVNLNMLWDSFSRMSKSIEAFRGRLSSQENVEDWESLLHEMSCDEDMLYVALEALHLWVAHPELSIKDFKDQSWSSCMRLVSSLGGELVHFSYDREHCREKCLQVLSSRDNQRELRRLVLRELELIMRDPDYLMMIEDASFFHEDSKNIRSASLSGRRVATPFFDENLLYMVDRFMDHTFLTLFSDPDLDLIQNNYRDLVNPLLRCALGYLSSPCTSNSAGVDGRAAILGLVERECLDYLFEKEPRLMVGLLQNYEFCNRAGSMVSRICARMLVHEEMVSSFRVVPNNHLLYGMPRAKVQRLENAYQRILWSTNFFAGIFMSCLPVFQNPEVDENRLLKSNIRDLFRLFFASSALPKRLFSDPRLCHFSQVQAIAIRQDKMVTSFTLEDMLSLLVLWTRQPIGQRFLANASGTANLRMFYYYPVELVYWNVLQSSEIWTSPDVIHRDMVELMHVWTYHNFKLTTAEPHIPNEVLEMSKYFIQRSDAPYQYHTCQADTKRFWELCHYFSGTLTPLAERGLLASSHWRLDNMIQWLSRHFRSNLYHERLVYYRLLRHYQGERLVQDFFDMICAQDVVIMQQELTLLQDGLSLVRHRQPLALDVSHFPEPDSDHPYAVVESQAQFEAIDPLKMLALASAFMKLHRPKLREMIRVHRTALARWLTRHFTAFLPELMRYDVTEQDVFALIPDLLSDVLSKEGEDALVMVNQLVENQKHFTSREYLRFLVKDCFQGYFLRNRAFFAEFYSRHRSVVRAGLRLFIEENDLFAFMETDKVSKDRQYDLILHLFESVLDSEHEEDLICLTDKLDRVLDVSPDSDIMYDMLDFVGTLSRLWQDNAFCKRFDFLRSDPCALGFLRYQIKGLNYHTWGMPANDVDLVRLFRRYALEYVSEFSDLSSKRWYLACTFLSKLENASRDKMSFQDISKHLLGFFSSSPTLIDKILTQLKAGQSNSLRHYVATHAVDGLLHWVKNDSGLTSREKNLAKSLDRKDLKDLVALISFLLTNIPQHPESYSSESRKDGLRCKNDVDFMQEVIEKFHHSPVLGWNMCLDVITLPYGSTPQAQKSLEKYFTEIDPCTKNEKNMLLLTLFVKLLNKSWLVPSIAKDCIERLFTNPKKARWYASLAQILLSSMSLFMAIFSKEYRKEVKRNGMRLFSSCWFFLITPIQLLVFDPMEFFVTVVGWMYLPLMILQHSITSAFNTISRFFLNLVYSVLGVFWPSQLRNVKDEPFLKTLENLVWSTLGVAISTGMALHLVGFMRLTFTHCALAVGYIIFLRVCTSIWPQVQRTTWKVFGKVGYEVIPLTSFDLGHSAAVAIGLEKDDSDKNDQLDLETSNTP